MFELAAMASIAFAWLIPNHYPPWTSIYCEACAALGLGVLLLARRRSWLTSRLPNLAWVIFAVAAVPVLQWAIGVLHFSGDAWVSSLYILSLGVAIAAGSFWAHANARDAASLLSGATLLAALLSSVFACVQALQSEALGLWLVSAAAGARSTANLGQPNNLATLLGLGVVGLLLLQERRKIGPAVSVTMLALLIVGATLTQSRTSLLFGPIIFLGLLVAKRRGTPISLKLSTVAVATLSHWALVFAWPTLQAALLLTAPESIAHRGLETPRLQMWPMLLHAASLSPWHGYGWLQVGAAELAVVNDYPPIGELWLHGHNLFLELVLWCGYPLGLALIGLIVYWYVTRLKRVRTLEAVVGMLVVSIFGLHAMLELPHHYLYFLVPVGLWIGMVEVAIGSRGSIPAGYSVAPFVLTALLGFAVLRDYPAIEENFRLVRFENLRIGSVHAAQPAPDAPFLSSLTGFLRFARSKPEAGMTPDALAEMQAAAERYPYAPSLARLASAWALNGRLDDAVDTFIKIRQIYGAGTYLKLKIELHERIDAGQRGLAPLYEALPN